jgi:hypothetical protein
MSANRTRRWSNNPEESNYGALAIVTFVPKLAYLALRLGHHCAGPK